MSQSECGGGRLTAAVLLTLIASKAIDVTLRLCVLGVFALMLLSLLAQSAHAQGAGGSQIFAAGEKNVVQGARSLLFGTPITHVGTPVKGPPLTGQEKDQAFVMALRKVVPQGWSAWEGKDLQGLPDRASWVGNNRQWHEVLADMLVPVGLRAEIDWTQRVVVLQPVRAPVPQAPTPTAAQPQAAVQEKAPAQEKKSQKWQLLPTDASIHAALARWSRQAEWTINYAGQNFVFEAPLEIEGDFRAAVCAVVDGINAALAGEPNARLVDAAFWPGNRVLRVFDDKPGLAESLNAPGGTCRKPVVMADRDSQRIAKANGSQP